MSRDDKPFQFHDPERAKAAMDRTDAFDANESADQLFGERGGMAVWFRREEPLPRVAVRHGCDDFVQAVMDVAMMRLGVEQLETAVSRASGIGVEDFRHAVTLATEVVRKNVDSVTRIKKSDKKEKSDDAAPESAS